MRNTATVETPEIERAKAQLETLQERKAAVEKEIEQITSVAQQEVSQRLLKARQEQSKVDEARSQLELDRKQLETMIATHRQEVESFEKEKEQIYGLRTECQAIKQRAQNFLASVRREAERL